ncbi:NAD(P)-dependent oxidoreductase [Phenylobacterium sp.]|uniref:NAD-dependent epimerase/dehydratase family protein n=1 Tax=Phenylobacterium sp. TaxID=1871053 RepID=UPI002733CC53|nr:NAD(P)-dependent oxidoreductase [Phenylobacterium sp.]MDP3634465.1 NAD(P)-dependent oxidoreductase [Phenylobacterium sp.]
MGRVLLTGATSFTGVWIAQGLAEAGHQVVAPLKRAEADYEGLRRDRVERLKGVAEVVFETPFGSPAFLDLLKTAGPLDILAHHAADIPGYRNADYDVAAGVTRNLTGAGLVFEAAAAAGVKNVIATGTGFEDAAGGLAVSPYGLSKRLTNDGFRHLALWRGLGFGRFMINGPFGALEEGRLVWSLFQAWFAGKAGIVRTPAYVRDNIPVVLLARAYADLVGEMLANPKLDRVCRPAGYVGAQGEFALRVAREASARLGRDCPVDCLEQTAFPEPRIVANDEPTLDRAWDEAGFWDAYVDYYREVERRGLLGAPA